MIEDTTVAPAAEEPKETLVAKSLRVAKKWAPIAAITAATITVVAVVAGSKARNCPNTDDEDTMVIPRISEEPTV